MMIDPCKCCHKYPIECARMCETKREYADELDGDVPVITKQKKKKVFDNKYNKNGIRRS